MRLLYVVHQFMPEFAGGTERVTLNLARAAQADGHHVEVVAATLGAEPRSTVVEGVPVHVFTRTAPNGLEDLGFGRDEAFAEGFERFLQRRPAFDAAHVMHGLRTLEAAEALAAWGVPYAVTLTDFFSLCHRINLMRLDGSLCPGPAGGGACQVHCPAPEIPETAFATRVARLGAVLRTASAVVAVSEPVAERVRAEHPDLTVRVVGNGVDLLSFPPPRPRPDRPLTFGYLGTISEPKGALLLARAFAVAAPSDARLRLVGPCYDPAIAEQISQCSADGVISVEEPVAPAEVGARLAQFDILCVPSQVPEAFSLALHEGFAAGLPALVSDLGNLGAVVRATGCGQAVEAADLGAWADAIAAIAADPTLVAGWRTRLPLPMRVEEEAFLYGQIYRGLASLRAAAAAIG